LQVSDLHLGRPFGWLPPEKRAERRLELREVWQLAVEAAISRKLDAILVPGDLFDGEEVDAETVNRAIECVTRPDCPPIFIAPGNHDCYSRSNTYYDNDKLVARGQPIWPAHVHIFKSPEFTRASVMDRDDVRFWGRCVHANVESDERALRDLPELTADVVRVALVHGSREGFRKPGKKLTAPFSDAEILESGFDYVALGHYHEPSEIRDAHGTLRAAYAGSAAALDRDETGLHGALEVSLTVDVETVGATRETEVTTARVELDPRKLVEVQVDLSGCGSSETGRDRVASALEQAGVRSKDLVSARLVGRPKPGVDVVPAQEVFADRVWFLHFDTLELRPDYDLDAYRTSELRTTEERFASALLREIDAETDPAQKTILEAALYYGLDALKTGAVAPRYEWGVK
jgi:DNA repair exonuclease SbcCD nuclease subunit